MPKTNRNIYQELLDNAYNLLRTTEFDKFSMRLLATSSNVALGTIYNYFSSKYQIVTTLVSLLWEDCIKELDTINYDDSLKSLKDINIVVTKYLNLFQTNWLKMLTSFTNDSKTAGKQLEEKYFVNIKNSIKKAFEFNHYDIITTLGLDRFCDFVFYNLFGMWRSQQDYTLFEIIITKLLSNKQED